MIGMTVSVMHPYHTHLLRGVLDAEDLPVAGLPQHVMETSSPGTVFKYCNGIIQAEAVQNRSGKKLTRNPVAMFKTSDVVDELNDSG